MIAALPNTPVLHYTTELDDLPFCPDDDARDHEHRGSNAERTATLPCDQFPQLLKCAGGFEMRT
ncbi:MAG: hypothetical protein ACE5IR_18690 [bacterium]